MQGNPPGRVRGSRQETGGSTRNEENDDDKRSEPINAARGLGSIG